MKVPIGGGSGPDTGPWWATEDKIYWPNGDITANAADGTFWRTSYCGESDGCVNYSAWTDGQRAEAKAKHLADVAAYDAKKDQEDEREFATLVGIKAKLTAEEWEYFQGKFEYRPECGWPE